MTNPLYTWLADYSHWFGWIAAGSFLLLLLSIVAAPWLVSRLPAGYLLEDKQAKAQPSVAYWLVGLCRNLIALVLLLISLLMLIGPGPGIVMLMLAVSVARVPGKHRVIRQLARRESIFHSLNWMRERYGKPPFTHPGG